MCPLSRGVRRRDGQSQMCVPCLEECVEGMDSLSAKVEPKEETTEEEDEEEERSSRRPSGLLQPPGLWPPSDQPPGPEEANRNSFPFTMQGGQQLGLRIFVLRETNYMKPKFFREKLFPPSHFLIRRFSRFVN